jgi:hypothetical protein
VVKLSQQIFSNTIFLHKFRTNFREKCMRFSRKSTFFVFAKIFEKNIRDFRENFCEKCRRFLRKFSRKSAFFVFAKNLPRNFAKICPFSHDFRIFAKIEKCIFVSTLVLNYILGPLQQLEIEI